MEGFIVSFFKKSKTHTYLKSLVFGDLLSNSSSFCDIFMGEVNPPNNPVVSLPQKEIF